MDNETYPTIEEVKTERTLLQPQLFSKTFEYRECVLDKVIYHTENFTLPKVEF